MRQRSCDGVGQSLRLFSPSFTRLRVTFDKDRSAAEVPGRFNIGQRIADQDTRLRCHVRELSNGPLEQSRSGFSAIALSFIVRTVVEPVNMCTATCEMLLEALMYLVDRFDAAQSKRNTSLIADNEDSTSVRVKLRNRVLNTLKYLELGPVRYVSSFRGLPIDHTIAVKENTMNTMRDAHGLGGRFHSAAVLGIMNMLA